MNLFSKTWARLLRMARLHPKRTGFAVFVGVALASLLVGWLASAETTPQGVWFDAINNAGVALGWVSMTAGWALALLAWAHRKEAEMSFPGAGEEVIEANKAFDASLILASRHCQPEWHLRHIQPDDVEFLWTPMVRDNTRDLLKKFPRYQPLFRLDEARYGIGNHDAYEVLEVKRHCLAILQWLLSKHPAGRICVDLTAGTATMTIAAFQAAEEAGVSSIYLLGQSEKGSNFIIASENIADPAEAKVIIVSDHRSLNTGE